ncbi:ROK family transcriptional regulator [Pedobacter nyackensis]|uniref:ROK family transcriptional regulator n=1 Tax=Pedobacter nyackensis TaxID=475255 RepID=UPI00292E48A0|nr:ROK family transcriptional regulator [Pedobacter nyackensis]
MKTTFEEQNDQLSGMAYKNMSVKKIIISYLANKSSATIADLCKEMNLSIPKVTTLISTLIKEGIVKDFGKVDSTGGRKPNVYGLIPDSGFFLGVDVKHSYINIGLIDLQKTTIKVTKRIPYQLSNDKEAFDELCKLIKEFIHDTSIPQQKILGMGINLPGRINHATGHSNSFFNFYEVPVTVIIEKELGIKTIIENDSRAMAYGEFSAGVVMEEEEEDVLFLNLDYGIGMGIVLNKKLYYGKSGFSGELGHIPLLDNEIICQCGKKGCLETVASGQGLIRMFKASVAAGYSTTIENDKLAKLQVADIIHAANNDDVLSIELLAKMGETLGRGIATLINIFNPELVVLGGVLAETGELIQLPIKSALNKYSLSMMNNDTKIKLSKLGEEAGVIGSCLLIRNKLLAHSA